MCVLMPCHAITRALPGTLRPIRNKASYLRAKKSAWSKQLLQTVVHTAYKTLIVTSRRLHVHVILYLVQVCAIRNLTLDTDFKLLTLSLFL